MINRTYTYIVQKDDDNNIVSIEPMHKITKTTIITTSKNYLDYENNYELSSSDAFDIMLAPMIFISFCVSCILVVMGIL